MLAASDCFGMAAAVHEAEGPPPRLPWELQSPIRSAAAARRTSDWSEWREKIEGEIHWVLITYSSTKAVPARKRQDLTRKLGGRRCSCSTWPCRSCRSGTRMVTPRGRLHA